MVFQLHSRGGVKQQQCLARIMPMGLCGSDVGGLQLHMECDIAEVRFPRAKSVIRMPCLSIVWSCKRSLAVEEIHAQLHAHRHTENIGSQ